MRAASPTVAKSPGSNPPLAQRADQHAPLGVTDQHAFQQRSQRYQQQRTAQRRRDRSFSEASEDDEARAQGATEADQLAPAVGPDPAKVKAFHSGLPRWDR